jgi:hypothetical protein
MRGLEFSDGRSEKEASSAISPSPERPVWLLSRRADFWLAGGGASVGLFAATLLVFCHGDRELDALDFVLSEFHLGATYDAVLRRQLWRQRQVDVLLVPLIILALTYALSFGGQTILLTSIAMYAAVWHRGRQNLGVARFYQRGMGGPASQAHDLLFRGAIYLPMAAATLAYSHLAPTQYDGEPYLALNLGAELTATVGLIAALWVIGYFTWAVGCNSVVRLTQLPRKVGSEIHPGEWWVVLAHAVAFGSGYVLGASSASFLLVLAVHHEVQYLYFAYAMARRSATVALAKTNVESAVNEVGADASQNAARSPRGKIKFIASFLLWPVAGFGGAVVGSWLQLGWLAPLGMGGLFCHYWLDGRIWTKQAFRN